MTLISPTCLGDCNLSDGRLYSTVLRDYDTTCKFLIAHGVIKGEYNCPKCNTILINKNGKFRCDKTVINSGEKTRCRVLSSGLKGTFFEKARLTFA